jgi:RecA-family ATPase
MKYTLKELHQKYKDAKPPDWVVDGLLRNNRPRPSLLCGLPHAGKSTLARQLAIAVSRGQEFLGRATKNGRVVYWQSEDSFEDAIADFQKQGADTATDNIIVMHSEKEGAQARESELIFVLEESATQGRPIDLVIIETLSDFLQPENENSNAELSSLLSSFSDRVVRAHQRTALRRPPSRDDADDGAVLRTVAGQQEPQPGRHTVASCRGGGV